MQCCPLAFKYSLYYQIFASRTALHKKNASFWRDPASVPHNAEEMRGPSQPVSRDLVRIIREASKLDTPGASLGEHLRAVDARQAQAVEFYFRACALRLEETP
jgi:hypothetical protein